MDRGGIGRSGGEEDPGELIVGEKAQFLVQKTAGQAAINLAFENKGHLSIANAQRVFMNQGYTQANTGTLTCEIAGDETFIPISVGQDETLALGGKLHINLAGGYIPDAEKTFKIFAYNSSVTLTGEFSEVTCNEISRDSGRNTMLYIRA